ncbi:zinc knuckle CX2CX4HX4C containing protein, partial [Tanacetum coccineum]
PSYARAMIDVRADVELKKTLVVAIQKLEGDGYILNTIRIEYEWEPPRCEVCMVFGHDDVTCPKRVVDEPKKQNGNYNDGFQQAPKITLCGINMSPKL